MMSLICNECSQESFSYDGNLKSCPYCGGNFSLIHSSLSTDFNQLSSGDHRMKLIEMAMARIEINEKVCNEFISKCTDSNKALKVRHYLNQLKNERKFLAKAYFVELEIQSKLDCWIKDWVAPSLEQLC